MSTKFIIEEYDLDWPWWEEVEDYDDYVECLKQTKRYRKAWPDTKYRIIKWSREIVNE